MYTEWSGVEWSGVSFFIIIEATLRRGEAGRDGTGWGGEEGVAERGRGVALGMSMSMGVGFVYRFVFGFAYVLSTHSGESKTWGLEGGLWARGGL